MGEWHHPKHYTKAAKDFAKATRKAEIAIFVRDALPLLREAAQAHGYALAVHGSMERDLDLIAVAWTDEANAPEPMVEALCAATKRATGWGHQSNKGAWTRKPNGRLATTIVATAEVHLDLSVIPLATRHHNEEKLG